MTVDVQSGAPGPWEVGDRARSAGEGKLTDTGSVPRGEHAFDSERSPVRGTIGRLQRQLHQVKAAVDRLEEADAQARAERAAHPQSAVAFDEWLGVNEQLLRETGRLRALEGRLRRIA